MPDGQLYVDSVTAELKPFAGVTVIVDVPVPPAAAVAAVAFKPKLGAPLTVSEMVVVADNVPLVPLTVSE
jgi:hypothetical protein